MSEEREAIWRLQQGDIGGLDYLVRHYQVRAIRAAYLVTHDAALAQDVVQAAFVKAYERISQFDPTRPFGPWFLTSVLHDAVKFAQERARHTSIEGIEEDPRSSGESLLEDERPGPEILWEQAETAEEVRAALLRLVPEQRRAVVARYFLGLSEAETAAAQSAPLSTIKWRLHDARRRLRLILTPTLLK